MFYPQELEVGEEVKKGDQITSVIGKQLVDKITTQTILTIKSIQEKSSFFFYYLVCYLGSLD